MSLRIPILAVLTGLLLFPASGYSGGQAVAPPSASLDVPARPVSVYRAELMRDGTAVILKVYWRPASGVPSLLHKPWIWDSGLQLYRPDTARTEDAVSVIWHDSANPEVYDIWYWGADRSSGSHTADDLSAVFRYGKFKIQYDNGTPGWQVVMPMAYEGLELPRYATRTPDGGQGGVSAVGEYSAVTGEWCVTFRREAAALETGDLPLVPERTRLTVFPRMPSRFDFEKMNFKTPKEPLLWQYL